MIEIKQLTMEFDGRTVLEDINATFEEGKCNLIIGRSGAGKTVLLKCLIGLLTPTRGSIYYNGTDVPGLPPKELKAFRTQMGVLFQGSALFDTMNVYENVLFPLQMFSRLPFSAKKKRARELLDRVGLADAGRKKIAEISGGMKKRAAIARALALEPKFLFCDEPNSGLDPQTSQSIDDLLYSLTKEQGITTVINTHDMNSVRGIGDNILYLLDGNVAWRGSMAQLSEPDLPDSLKSFLLYH